MIGEQYLHFSDARLSGYEKVIAVLSQKLQIPKWMVKFEYDEGMRMVCRVFDDKENANEMENIFNIRGSYDSGKKLYKYAVYGSLVTKDLVDMVQSEMDKIELVNR